jgi:glycosyltransferase involved in cell wall biosynthesis
MTMPDDKQSETTPPETAETGMAAKAGSGSMELTVIVPARNEEDCLGACLESLVSQSNDFFQLGRDWELLVVDDGSTDRTRAIAMDYSDRLRGVILLSPAKLEKGWTGKANACWTAAQRARGQWLLFTDADTLHEPGNLRRAMHEAEKHAVGVLSYSPRQLVNGLWQRALMPLVFSELALAYPPEKVSNPELRIAAANGQFLLASRKAYDAIGGHASVKGDILEDVELAFLAKKRKVGLRFRYAADALSTRMYRSAGAMIEGWTKNLALLFGNCLILAAWRVLDVFLLIGLPLLAWRFWSAGIRGVPYFTAGWLLVILWLRNLWRFYARIGKSNFPALDCFLSPLALPLFAALLYRSWFQNTILKRVSWKGRTYPA